MANFTSEIRRELLKSAPERRCCRLALLAAFLETSGAYLCGRRGDMRGFSFTSEHEDVAEFLLFGVEGLFGVRMTVAEAVRDPKHGRDKLTFSYTGPDAGKFAEELYACRPTELGECCSVAFLKGAFLGSGSCTLPQTGRKTGYHLEFVFRGEEEAVDFLELLDRVQIIGGVLPRAERHIVYLKNRESISDLLDILGARSALSTLEKISAAREDSNNENRTINCMAGNADRAATASVRQVVAISALKNGGVFETLPAPLQEVARARLDNPACSLGELAEKLNLSKSCVNHRLRKLMQIYSEKHS